MARERIENGSVTLLNGTIDNSTTTVAVADASVFSPLPQFRIIIDSEIMLVTAIAGNSLTVTRGAESSLAAAHTDGANVAQIITREGIQRMQRDWNNPFFDDSNAIPHQLINAAGGVLTSTSFADINFAGDGTTSKTDQSQGSILVEKQAQGAANNFGLMVIAAPAAPWVWTVGFIPNLFVPDSASDLPTCGACVRDDMTGEFYHFGQSGLDAIKANVFKFNSPTATATAFIPGDFWSGSSRNVTWFQVEDDNTDLIFRLSADGINFIEIGREARLTFLTPDQIGISVNNFGNPVPLQTTLVAWDES